MRFSEEDIKEYQKLWKKEFGEEISVGKALESANQLLELYRIVLRKKGEGKQKGEG